MSLAELGARAGGERVLRDTNVGIGGWAVTQLGGRGNRWDLGRQIYWLYVVGKAGSAVGSSFCKQGFGPQLDPGGISDGGGRPSNRW